MPDRIMVISNLGGLVREAAQRGDDRAATLLQEAIGVLVADETQLALAAAEAEAARRHRERGRQRQRRFRDSRVSERDVTLRDVSKRHGSPGVPPSRALPSLPTPSEDNNDNYTAREARGEAKKSDAAEREQDELIERYAAMLHDAVGDPLFPDVDGFVKRRPYATWLGWLREMLSLIGPGSQFVPADLAQVCRDDAALDRRIGTPKGLRSFLGSVRAERVTVTPNGPNGGKPSGGVAARTFRNGMAAFNDGADK